MLYIDPGTGSMLFSVLISLFALGYFAFRGVLIKLRLLFAGKKGSARVLDEAAMLEIYRASM